jgi:hypothetical protein
MVLDIERENTRFLSVEERFWKRLWACSKSDCLFNEGSKSIYL